MTVNPRHPLQDGLDDDEHHCPAPTIDSEQRFVGHRPTYTGGLVDLALRDAELWFEELAIRGIDLTGNAHLKVVHEASEFSEEPSLEEAADVVIAVMGALHQLGHNTDDLGRAIIAKTLVNRKRSWGKLDDGTWQHTP